MSEKPTNHQVYVAARIGYIGVHPDFIETKAQRDRAREYDEMIAEVERASAARALEEAADDDEFFARSDDDRSDEFNEGVNHGADQLFGALRARAAEIREGKQ